MEYGKYDETARYFRRMDELAEQLAAADPDALEPQKVKASAKATLGDFQLDRIGDAEAALKLYRPGPRPSPSNGWRASRRTTTQSAAWPI